MRKLSGDEIRSEFLKFFEKKGHEILPSASLVPDDPQLMFTVAGMVPFKPIFWGKVDPVYKRVTTCQKCLRTTDIENVGRTPRHHTFFEMLGNFSFGDYFKREAIEWAWEFVTDVLEIPEDRLWVTIYEEDDESFKIWNEVVGLPEWRIVRMGEKDNFWGPAGPTGPCGPDSEIHYLLDPSCEGCSPKTHEDKFLEIWNLVFTELYMDENGDYHPLERKNIDTGAGLERLAAVLQNTPTNFDTDIFKPIIERIQEVLDVEYGKNEKSDTSIKVVADHIRAITFLIADGVFPSNEGRGYVLRRIIRRAQRYVTLLRKSEPVLYKIVDAVVRKMGKVYPEIVEKQALVEEILKAEEERFLKTLDQGMGMLEELLGRGKISGSDAFKLYDTYGFPIDLTIEIARDRGVEVDVEGFRKEMETQRERARKALGEVEYSRKEHVFDEILKRVRVEFTGYEKMEDESEIVALVRDGREVERLSEGEEGIVVVEKTPFYAEKGGQVADTGKMVWDGGSAEVVDVRSPAEGLIVHFLKIKKGNLRRGNKMRLIVDKSRRKSTMRNHTATHLLHAALRKVLGSHVRQAGSLVSPERLRFDFTHYKALSDEEIAEIENLVNEKIMEAIPVVTEIKSYDEAVREGAMALFEEKYGDTVRVVKIGDFSEELCGGTHVSNTGEIGMFRIVSEEAISAGIRRIVAVTGFGALDYSRENEKIVCDIRSILDVPKEKIVERLEKLLRQIKDYEKKIKELQTKQLSKSVGIVRKDINGVSYAVVKLENVPGDVLRNTADSLLSKLKSGIAVVFNVSENKVSFVVKVSKDLTDRFKAADLARRMAKVLGGGGGGREDFAQAGGKDQKKIEDAMKELEKVLGGD